MLPSTPKGIKHQKIRICYKNQTDIQCGTLIFNYLPKRYAHSIYNFLKSLIPVGRILKL
ncbi:DUF735 family protein (plasmid) [Borrelia miyamotoi]|uniref:DUF735 family protein n=1 Tax=Borrelia miyamotoi TaxID=47466 RepID=A0AAQ3HFP2_9SPIR|nr:DUF735 family protein [Borrelia miyamotoi]WAZ71053.1 DUF735 family protein [Borrelia miyamotoi]WCB91034.1 DUF735 family protein [Borrelia miyamotoi]WCL22163.1 DUF735 family protein [Borrelia miyamotoi]WDE70391.1 DUF735 family protein [Borrelia miyamotoi]WDE71666.1 DUF735 family protein [Borrelia miyamotoi]